MTNGARTPSRVGHRLRTGVKLGLVVTAAFAVLLAGAPAHGDDLTDQKKAVERQISQTKKDLDESTKQLSGAVVALQKSQSDLAAAQARLAKTQRDLAAAKLKDAQMAARLATAQKNLDRAKKAVATGQKQIDAQRLKVGLVVRTEVQQQTNLLGIALLTSNSDSRDMSNRVQYASTIFGATQSGMDQLQSLQAKLERDKANQVAIETQVAADRKEAAANLATTKKLEQQAVQDRAAVAELVRQNAAARAAAAQEVAGDKARYQKLQDERNVVQRRIEARIAAAKAAAARKAAAERRAAAAHAAAVKRAEAAQRAARSKAAKRAAAAKVAQARREAASSRSSRSSSGSSSSGSSRGSSAHHGFIYPVNAPITSPYGMRFHPVLHYWKLHDGTDFGAGCGTAIHAPYSGKVVEKYYNAGYGNRLIIDHGNVDGRYVTTAMNHAIRYTVGVGQHVSQGQVIGYVGTTGYSTGCHLHLMVWLDGRMVNPMSWY